MDTLTFAVEAEAEATHWWFVGRRRLFSSLLTLRQLAPDAPILDIGTSTGTNLRMLRDLGFSNFQGVDLSDDAIVWCATKGLGKVTKGDVCDLPFADGQFQFVLATDIIEHVDDDLKALTEIRRVLAPNGAALVTVPAFSSLWGLQDDVARHKRRYRKQQLLRLIGGAGLRCSDSFYFNFLLFLPIWLARQIMHRLRISLASENEVNTPMLNRLLTAVFSLDVTTAPSIRPPFGVSIAAVVERTTQDPRNA